MTHQQIVDVLTGQILTLQGIMGRLSVRNRSKLVHDLNALVEYGIVERGKKRINGRYYITYTAVGPDFPPPARDGSMRPSEVRRVIINAAARYGDEYARRILEHFNSHRRRRGIREVTWESIVRERGYEVARKL